MSFIATIIGLFQSLPTIINFAGVDMSDASSATLYEIEPKEYHRRIWAWTMYDWANSAFATTILAAVLPVYFSQVAAANLPSAAMATSLWSAGLSVSLLIIALIAPILGTVSDITRSKKRYLAFFAGIGITSTALLVLVSTGDWLLAFILGIIGRIGFNGANTFYDSLLPHVAKAEDQDTVSARGYAMGYLGGGLLLAINVVMLQVLPGTWGARLSFVSVAIWWAVFSIPLFRRVPEPHTAGKVLEPGESVLSAGFKRLRYTIGDIKRYRELFKYLISFLIYNDGIGTIIGVAAIYGAELGFGAVELVLALLLVQFVGIPYSLIFGRLPKSGDTHRPFYLAFVLLNMIFLPMVGVLGARLLPANLTGAISISQVGLTLERQSNLGVIIGIIVTLELVLLAISFTLGSALLSKIAPKFDTKRSILLALAIYAIVAIWGYFLNSVIEFWFLAWMVAIVQGGSQALSRSLYCSMSPAAKSGEFFGLFGIMEKFSAIIGPALFASAGVLFGSSRPAILSLIIIFFLGGYLLNKVNVFEGQRVARMEDAEIYKSDTSVGIAN
jgi:UMF1 family MFS transporter